MCATEPFYLKSLERNFTTNIRGSETMEFEFSGRIQIYV